MSHPSAKGFIYIAALMINYFSEIRNRHFLAKFYKIGLYLFYLSLVQAFSLSLVSFNRLCTFLGKAVARHSHRHLRHHGLHHWRHHTAHHWVKLSHHRRNHPIHLSRHHWRSHRHSHSRHHSWHHRWHHTWHAHAHHHGPCLPHLFIYIASSTIVYHIDRLWLSSVRMTATTETHIGKQDVGNAPTNSANSPTHSCCMIVKFVSMFCSCFTLCFYF